MVVTAEDLNKTQKAGVTCTWRAFHFTFNLASYWWRAGRPCPQDDANALDLFRRNVVPICMSLHKAQSDLHGLLSPEVRNVILRGASQVHQPSHPPKGWSMWHDMPLDKAYSESCRIVTVNPLMVEDALPAGADFSVAWEDWENGNAEATLLRIGWGFWNEVCNAAKECKHEGFEPREIVAGIEKEWAASVASCDNRQDTTAGNGSNTDPKQKVSDDKAALVLAALLEHHKYGSPKGLNEAPVGVRELARSLDGKVSRNTVQRWFTNEFHNGHCGYKAVCAQHGMGHALKLLNGDYSPRELRTSLKTDTI